MATGAVDWAVWRARHCAAVWEDLEVLDDEELRVRVVSAREEPGMVSDPQTLDEALRQIELLRSRLSESGKTASAAYQRVSQLDRENKTYKAGYEALRELLAAYTDAGGGWRQGPLVPSDDFLAMLAAACL